MDISECYLELDPQHIRYYSRLVVSYMMSFMSANSKSILGLMPYQAMNYHWSMTRGPLRWHRKASIRDVWFLRTMNRWCNGWYSGSIFLNQRRLGKMQLPFGEFSHPFILEDKDVKEGALSGWSSQQQAEETESSLMCVTGHSSGDLRFSRKWQANPLLNLLCQMLNNISR
jgi:hypothetical protein